MSLAPPDGWSVTSGVWGTNLDIDTSVYASGLASLRLSYDVAIAAPIIYSPWIPLPNRTVIPPSSLLPATRVRIRASSIAGGDTVTVVFEQYPQDRTTLTSSTTLHDATLSAANTWEEYGSLAGLSNNVVWGRFRITKANTNFNCWVDMVHCVITPPHLFGYPTSTPLTSGVWTPLTWSAISSSMINLVGSSTIRIYESGLYTFSATPNVNGLADNENISIQLRRVSPAANYFLATYRAAGTGNVSFPIAGAFFTNDNATLPYTDFQIQMYVSAAGRTANISLDASLAIVKNK